jgi:DNA-binding response OmpR family regulator
MKNVRILYVEDEPFLGKIVKESLESRSFEVNLVGDGRLVIEAFEKFCPDVCVLDVMLPNRDGFSLGQEIRRNNPAIPILFLSAKNQTQDVLQGFESGGNDYIRKPFSMEELIVRIQNLLVLSHKTTPQSNRPSQLKIGRFSFFPQQQELRFNDTAPRLLSFREAQLLEMLSANQNQAVARKDILDNIWGNDSFFNSRNLDVYISKLRDYLKRDENVMILTLKGVGYRLVC